MGEFSHKPVLLREVLTGLDIRPDGVYADGTLGGGGHAEAILERIPNGTYIAVDQDPEALAAATARLAPFGDRLRVFRANYEQLPDILRREAPKGADGILLDLGVSSYQLDSPERGFSYRADGPLDMRMDPDGPVTAADIVNTESQETITKILRDYGEEKFAAVIARNIVSAREKAPIETTGQLTDIVRRSIPRKAQAGEGHPAKRTFQALRIAANRELDVLEQTLDGLIDVLAPGGRLAVITFHSLEDRIVKNAFRTAEHPCICPPSFPVCTCGRVSKGKVITRKPILPSEEELAENRRAASAKLRIFQKAPGSGFDAPVYGTLYPKGTKIKHLPDGTIELIVPEE
ncbi:MAG: 16S rRNA (cytosine(1402)-N(4))-methyltransferase RsmH [Lachnospiraceae bacterium]|nr:16S rRNA (cytosine(1402)-N(4))-methyltransferase RsmH [Lachnospiraceae bacterium]